MLRGYRQTKSIHHQERCTAHGTSQQKALFYPTNHAQLRGDPMQFCGDRDRGDAFATKGFS